MIRRSFKVQFKGIHYFICIIVFVQTLSMAMATAMVPCGAAYKNYGARNPGNQISLNRSFTQFIQ